MVTHSRNAGKRMSTMFTTGVGRHANRMQFDNYMTNTIDTFKSKMAAWYVYGKHQISNRTFDDKYSRNMMESCYHCDRICAPASQERGSEVPAGKKDPSQTAKVLKYWVRAYFEVFFLLLKLIMSHKHHHAMGNSFAQALHDGGTLDNGKKYQAL